MVSFILMYTPFEDGSGKMLTIIDGLLDIGNYIAGG